MTAPKNTNHRDTTAAALLERRVEQTEKAAERIDRDVEEALSVVAPITEVTPGAGEVTPQDMFRLMTQMQQQMAGMQEQILGLMSGKLTTAQPQANRDTAAELAQDKLQRDATLEAWRTEPRRPVWIQPDQDEEKIFAVTNAYPPRMFRINALEYPIKVGEIQEVPGSVASVVEHTQKKRPMQNGPQGLPLIPDPTKGPFLAASQSIEVGRAGKAGEGRIVPEGQPPITPLGERYDAYGQ